MKRVHTGSKPSKRILHPRYCYIVDCTNEIFLWVGREASIQTKNLAMKVAGLLLPSMHKGKTIETFKIRNVRKMYREEWTRVILEHDDSESALFADKFSDFPRKLPVEPCVQKTVLGK